jgi:hypothetical protein
MDGNSSYQFKPKAPDNWSVKTYDRNGKKVKLIRLKPWQLEAHLLLRGATFGFLRAFCGSGKTIVARSIAAYKILATGKRQVFCVPKNEIGNDGFASYFDIEIPGARGRKRVLHCDAPLNFCSARSSSKIDELIRILCKDPVVDDCAIKNRIVSSMQIVITHQCLTLAVKKIKKGNPQMLERFIKNNTFWIDEGHHIKGHDESEEEKSTMNLLGKFVNKVLNSEEKGVELFAMTATPYRGDYSRLFSANQLDGFVNYSLDFLVHFPTLGIEKVDMELEEYSDIDDVIKRVCYNIGKELANKHFVFVPPTGRKWRKNQSDVEKLFQAIYEVIMQKTGCDLEKAKSMVLDLVTKSTQSFNDKLLRQEPKGGDDHASKFTVVVACMKCREGSDWCPADRIHNTSMEDSPPFIFQTNGRLFRYFPEKKQVKIRYYREKFKTISIGKREFVSDRVNSILHYMLMDDILNPIMVNVPTFISSKKKKEERDSKRKYTTLEEIFSHQYQEMKRFLLTGMADMDFNEKSVDQIIAQSMQKYLPEKRKFTKGQVSKIKMALKVFLLRCRSGELRTQGIDASFIRKNGFDSVVEKKIGGNMYTSNLALPDLKKFRETAKKISLTEEQKREICAGIHKIVSENLPGKKKNDQDYLDHFAKILREFVRFQKKYAGSFGTKCFSPQGLAKLVKKSFDHTNKMIGLFNKYCLKKDICFDFSKDSKLAGKFVSLRAA